MPKTKLLDIVDVLETYADLYDMFDDNRLVYEALDKVNEELRAIPSVKAIPIEWLKKWAETNSNGEWSVEYRTVFNGILKDWENNEWPQ